MKIELQDDIATIAAIKKTVLEQGAINDPDTYIANAMNDERLRCAAIVLRSFNNANPQLREVLDIIFRSITGKTVGELSLAEKSALTPGFSFRESYR
ncbi:hypothetical protein V9K92_10630 [Phyllobacterium sp. CCNWLW109]|uniref:hypothetical protein n=1 Tax=Phyllobacterium sp. CCNWLW109 TaxID=3127479 RepID=UPI0030780988